MKIGYARVSTTDQNLEIQLQELKKAGCEKIYKEKVSGTHLKRPELLRMLDQLRQDDQVIVWKLDRLARSTRDLLAICDQITYSKANFRSLSEAWADTTTPGGKMILTVFAGIAEFERELIVERTSSGRQAAQKRGVRFGRPPKLDPNQITAIKNLLEKGNSVKEVAKIFKAHPATIYRFLSQ
jgi:DNA invertase Pin-like site-specific DNA recombinase